GFSLVLFHPPTLRPHRGAAQARRHRARRQCPGPFQRTRPGRSTRSVGERSLVGAGHAGRRPPARARHPLGGQHRHVPSLLQLQGRPGARAVLDAPSRHGGAVIRTWALSQDLSRALAWAAIGLALLSLLLLGMELRRRRDKGLLVVLTGVVATAL